MDSARIETPPRPRESSRLQTALKWALIAVALLLLWWLWEPLRVAFEDPESLQRWVAALGVWGPLTIVALSVLQVWIAPLPGYPVVFVSGILFGTGWGALWANLGIMAAGVSTAYIARSVGRPLVERMVNEHHLTRLDPLLANESRWFWFWVLFLPTGDLPYFAAGLGRVRLWDFAIALAAARLPFTIVLTWAARHAITLPRSYLLLLMVPVALVALALYWQRDRLQRWTTHVLGHLSST